MKEINLFNIAIKHMFASQITYELLEAMREACEEVVNECSENAELKFKIIAECSSEELESGFIHSPHAIIPNKQSILKVKTQIINK